MKKISLSLIAAGMIAFAACDGLLQTIVDNFLGNATVTLTGDDGARTTEFSSSVCNAVSDTLSHTLLVAANIDLTEENVAVTNPYFVVNITDTAVGTYAIPTLTLGLFKEHDSFSTETLMGLLDEYNLALVMESELSWYVAVDGSVTITDYPSVNHEVKGSITGTMVHITQGEVDAIEQVRDALREEIRSILIEEGYGEEDDLDAIITERLKQMPITRVFPNTVSISGNFSSLRMERSVIDMIGD